MNSLADYAELLEEALRRKRAGEYITRFHRLYDWQREFIASTATHTESMLCAANQIGKTYLGTYIDAVHLMGEYPEEWDGHRFMHAPVVWGLEFSMEKCRDLMQTALFGDYIGNRFVGGIIPADRIVSWESAMGTPNAMRTVRVKHISGGISKIQFWSYGQGHHALMGDVVDFFHIDEEPVDQKIGSQVVTRTLNGDKGKGGRGIYTFTPENGRTPQIIKFMENPAPDQFFMRKGWDDAPHMTEEKKAARIAKLKPHEVDMRTKGIPMLGHGRIFDMSEEWVTCEPFEIPPHWHVINGMDFGWDHPQAHIQLVEDRDNERFYLTHSWKGSRMSATSAMGVIGRWAKNVPTAWPHDGLQHEKGRDGGVRQMQHYVDAGFEMLLEHATWPTGGNAVEAGIYELNQLFMEGRLKVFRGCREFFDEFSQYHRDENGKIVKAYDDTLDALRYAYMMRRYAIPYGQRHVLDYYEDEDEITGDDGRSELTGY